MKRSFGLIDMPYYLDGAALPVVLEVEEGLVVVELEVDVVAGVGPGAEHQGARLEPNEC